MQLQGRCLVLLAYDVGFATDLDRAAERLSAARDRSAFRHRRAVPDEEGALAASVRSRRRVEPPDVGRFEPGGEVELALFASGALVVTWTVPFAGEAGEWTELVATLQDQDELRRRSRALVEEELALLGPAVQRPGVARAIEDYLVVQAEPVGWRLEDAAEEELRALAHVLRAEPGPLSDEEVTDALARRLSYAPGEAVWVDWLASVLLGADTEDERRVLELATVELLGLRVIEAQLDAAVDEAYGLLGRRRGWLAALATGTRDLERLAELRSDGAALLEGVDNAQKLVGDDYLARLHRAASARFRLAEWGASIERKLAALEGVYRTLAEQAGRRRSELLEWIIIVLIAVEIVRGLSP